MDYIPSFSALDAGTDTRPQRTATIRKPVLRSVPRHDVYFRPHAALRACMAEALGAVARMDPDDPADVSAITMRMQELIALFSGHLANEDAFVHPAMEARRPGSTARIAHDHAEHIEGFARLEGDLAALRNTSASRRPDAVTVLHCDLAAFVAANLVHMAAEERDHNAVLWATHTDEEIAAIEASIIASIPPHKMSSHLRWMVPALPPKERLAVMRKVQELALPQVFDATLALVQPCLNDREWLKLVGGLTSR
jgi:hemerythrin HHE cation binding domain-containing protein